MALAPTSIAAMTKKGFTVRVEEGAGAAANFPNAVLEQAGATIVDKQTAFASGTDCHTDVQHTETALASGNDCHTAVQYRVTALASGIDCLTAVQ